MSPLVVYLEAMNLPESLICVYRRQNRIVSHTTTTVSSLTGGELWWEVTGEAGWGTCLNWLALCIPRSAGSKAGLIQNLCGSVPIQDDFCQFITRYKNTSFLYRG